MEQAIKIYFLTAIFVWATNLLIGCAPGQKPQLSPVINKPEVEERVYRVKVSLAKQTNLICSNVLPEFLGQSYNALNEPSFEYDMIVSTQQTSIVACFDIQDPTSFRTLFSVDLSDPEYLRVNIYRSGFDYFSRISTAPTTDYFSIINLKTGSEEVLYEQ